MLRRWWNGTDRDFVGLVTLGLGFVDSAGHQMAAGVRGGTEAQRHMGAHGGRGRGRKTVAETADAWE